MKFDDLDSKMRIYETQNDISVLPGMYLIARIDGRGFTKLTKEQHNFEKPFDKRFNNIMIETLQHLMNCGFNVIYGYTQSDEISLLFHFNENSFARKRRKFISLLAGEASAKFSVLLGDVAAFDCRIIELPNASLVLDYFRWRQEDAHRNSLSAHCYWLLRQNGQTPVIATQHINKMSSADKNEMLFSYGINFNELPSWQKRGIGIYWKNVIKEGLNPIDNTLIKVERRKMFIDEELPIKEKYDQFIESILNS
ncbi:guanylyltransferase [Chitinophaga silvatica]|uniref:tRNA(His) guanylyltransferase n=1 Tax=Chitinophaga silvatica TaxID=2282649 RepID=A0A3E1YHZ3_9BACT|nr:tRNA(His) guanylyltransferase Thg1 family protein [Chitinophaga silvatica]RFS26991.1 guanylyltransferase [Chitinophaga silvatica]